MIDSRTRVGGRRRDGVGVFDDVGSTIIVHMSVSLHTHKAHKH